jgi:hypothetical protein
MPFKLPYLGLKLKLNTVRMTSRSAVWPLCDLNLRAALASRLALTDNADQ